MLDITAKLKLKTKWCEMFVAEIILKTGFSAYLTFILRPNVIKTRKLLTALYMQKVIKMQTQ